MQSAPHLSPRFIRAGTALLLVAVLIATVACGLGGAHPTATPTTAAAPSAALAVATATPTAAPPTVTPAPTSTPTVAASAPGNSPTVAPPAADRQRYLAAMRDIAEQWEAWSADSNALMNEVGQDPLAICITRSGDIDAQVAGGRDLLAALSAATPPEEIASEHNRLVSEGAAGLDALVAGKEALCRRLDAGTAMAKMEEVNAHLAEAYAAAGAVFVWAQEAQSTL